MPGRGQKDWASHLLLPRQSVVHQDAENLQKTFCYSKHPGINLSQNSPDGEEPGTTHQPQGLFWRGEITAVGHGCLRVGGEWQEHHEQGAVPRVEGKDPTALESPSHLEGSCNTGLTLLLQTKGHNPAQNYFSFPLKDIFLPTSQLP